MGLILAFSLYYMLNSSVYRSLPPLFLYPSRLSGKGNGSGGKGDIGR